MSSRNWNVSSLLLRGGLVSRMMRASLALRLMMLLSEATIEKEKEPWQSWLCLYMELDGDDRCSLARMWKVRMVLPM